MNNNPLSTNYNPRLPAVWAALDVGAEVIHDTIRFKDQAQRDAFTARLAEIPFNYPPLPPIPVPRA